MGTIGLLVELMMLSMSGNLKFIFFSISIPFIKDYHTS